jgi:vacuolar-type H+-ATPase subunit F/Vma7
MSAQQLEIAVIGDEELVNALRLAGVSRYYMIKDDDIADSVRKALADVMGKHEVGIILMLEDYMQYAEDLVAQIRKGRRMAPVIIDVPSKFGTKYADVREYYRASIRESVGFEVEI